MPLDPSIALQTRPIQIEAPGNALARVLQIQNAQQQNALGRLQLADAQTNADETGAVRNALGRLAPGATLQDRIAALHGTNTLAGYKQADALSKALLDQQKLTGDITKTSVETDAARFKSEHAKATAMLDLIGSAKDQASYDAALAQGKAMGLTPNAPPQYDPAFVANSQRQALTSVQRIEQEARQRGLDLTQRGQDLADKRAAQSDATTRRGQDMTDSRTRASLAETQRHNSETEGVGKRIPIGYRYTTDENGDKRLEPIPGGPKDPSAQTGKPLPASAAKGLLENQQNLRRAQSAMALLEGKQVGEAKGDPEATGLKGLLPNTILNRVDPAGVETRAAIADLGSLVIHDRSGAAVTAAEFPRLAPFIPSATDDAATAKKKVRQFVKTYSDIVGEAADFYTASGFNVPAGQLRNATPGSGSYNDPDKERRYQEWKARQGR